jgi:hypothetical protein
MNFTVFSRHYNMNLKEFYYKDFSDCGSFTM